MQFTLRAAAAAAILATSTLIAASTPGLAFVLDKPLRVAPLQPLNGAVTTNVPIDPQLVTTPVASAVAVDPISAPSAEDDTPPNDDVAKPRVAAASLAAAVAAQSLPESPSDDLRCLASAIYFEAKGEPLAGQLGVAQVILNRTRSGRFPRSVCGVVTQRGQFSFVRGGQMPTPGARNAAYRVATAIAQIALDEAWESPVPQALFFHAVHVSPNWGKQRVASIGRHVFYR